MSKKPNLTQWINGRVHPDIPGVYERQFVFGPCYSRWTGSQWLTNESYVAVAAKEELVSDLQSLEWRGLAQKP